MKDVARTGSFIDDDVLCPRVPSSLQWNVVNHKSWTRASQSRKRQFYCANRAAISRESNRLDQLPWDISKRERQAGDKLFCYARCHIEPLLITYLNELERRKNQPLKTRSVASRGSHTYVWSTPNIRKVFMAWSRDRSRGPTIPGRRKLHGWIPVGTSLFGDTRRNGRHVRIKDLEPTLGRWSLSVISSRFNERANNWWECRSMCENVDRSQEVMVDSGIRCLLW